MKRLLILILSLVAITSYSQTTVTTDKFIAKIYAVLPNFYDTTAANAVDNVRRPMALINTTSDTSTWLRDQSNVVWIQIGKKTDAYYTIDSIPGIDTCFVIRSNTGVTDTVCISSNGTGGSSTDTNLANADLTFSGNHTADLSAYSWNLFDGVESSTDYTSILATPGQVKLHVVDALGDHNSYVDVQQTGVSVNSSDDVGITAKHIIEGSNAVGFISVVDNNADSLNLYSTYAFDGNEHRAKFTKDSIVFSALLATVPATVNFQIKTLPLLQTPYSVFYDPSSGKLTYGDTTGGTGGGGSPAWELTGNAGNVLGTNFLGNTDAVSLEFRVNNERGGLIDASSLHNTSFGHKAFTTTGTGNINTAIGYLSMYASNTTGQYNAALGGYSLYSNITGYGNTASGFFALKVNTDGYQNTATGYYALSANTTGTSNVANGSYALSSNTTGGENISVGQNSLTYILSNNGNVAVGGFAGTFLPDGFTHLTNSQRSTYIGYRTSGYTNGNSDSMIVIGAYAQGRGSNTATIGTTSITSTKLFGNLNLAPYGAGSVTGTATYGAAFDASGNVIEVALAGGGSTYTVDNGLDEPTSGNFQLGGDLLHNTYINSDYEFKFNGLGGNAALSLANGSGGSGLEISTSSTGVGIYVTSAAQAAAFYSTSSYAIEGSIGPSDASSVQTIYRATRGTSSIPADGIGTSFDFITATVNGGFNSGGATSNQLISKWTTASLTTRTSEFIITGVNSATTNNLLTLTGAGLIIANQGLQDFADNAAAISGGLTTVGTLYRNGDVVQVVH